MPRLLSRLSIFLLSFVFCLLSFSTPTHAQINKQGDLGVFNAMITAVNKEIVFIPPDACTTSTIPAIQDICSPVISLVPYISGRFATDAAGQVYNPGLLGTGSKIIASIYDNQPSSREYIADLLDNIGIPQVSSAYAQGTGYAALTPFLAFWKGFRNLAYSLYIIMFVVVGVMIMLRTKVNAQTVITIQSALPNLVITLLLITFSYAIVGFMIDLMYFLIYALVYLLSAANIISTPTETIARLLGYPAWGVIFEGRNSIISATAHAIEGVISGLGTGLVGLAGQLLSISNLTYLIVAVWLAIAMIKLMFALIRAYVMLIVQTVTAPLQLLLNAMPGSQAFSKWLKTTASYLIPFPVAAAMFIMAAVFIGDPTSTTILQNLDPRDANHFGINSSHEFYQGTDNMWMPPFTLSRTDISGRDFMVVIGLFIFTMTPAVVKMAQEWMQVKESPYTSEIGAGLGGAWGIASMGPKALIGGIRAEHAARRQATLLGRTIRGPDTQAPGAPTDKDGSS